MAMIGLVASPFTVAGGELLHGCGTKWVTQAGLAGMAEPELLREFCIRLGSAQDLCPMIRLVRTDQKPSRRRLAD
jgi:hypothetical protein